VAPFLWKIEARELTDMPKPAIDSASVDAPVKEERSIFEAGQPEPTEMPPHSGIILGIILVSYFMIVLNNSIIFTGLPQISTNMPKLTIDSATVEAHVKEERYIFEAGQPEPTEMSPHSGIILGIILVSYFMIVLNNSIIFTGLPQIRAEMGLSANGMAWAQNA